MVTVATFHVSTADIRGMYGPTESRLLALLIIPWHPPTLHGQGPVVVVD